jgi:hypothetical protein
MSSSQWRKDIEGYNVQISNLQSAKGFNHYQPFELYEFITQLQVVNEQLTLSNKTLTSTVLTITARLEKVEEMLTTYTERKVRKSSRSFRAIISFLECILRIVG